MKFKDVAHLYLGCKGRATYNAKNENTGDVISVGLSTLRRLESVGIQGDRRILMWVGGNLAAHKTEPILRRLQDMTEEERQEVITLGTAFWNGKDEIRAACYKANASVTAYLTSRSFDLFGFIDSGEAVDSTKISQTLINKQLCKVKEKLKESTTNF